ncbi:hypothetical protein ABT030_03130 [Streptomyces mirabilis]
MATTDPAGLPEKATWYLATNLLHLDAPHAAASPHPPKAVRPLETWPREPDVALEGG